MRTRHVLASVTLYAALCVPPAVAGKATYLYRADAREQARLTAAYMYESMIRNGSKVKRYDVVPTTDCRHRGKRIVVCDYWFTFDWAVICPGTMRVKLKYGQPFATPFPRDCYSP